MTNGTSLTLTSNDSSYAFPSASFGAGPADRNAQVSRDCGRVGLVARVELDQLTLTGDGAASLGDDDGTLWKCEVPARGPRVADTADRRLSECEKV